MRSLLLTMCILLVANANAQETKTSMGFVLSPNFSSIRYVDDGTLPEGFVDQLESGTNGSLGLSGNIFFQYELTDKFFISWGLCLQNYRYKTTYYTQSQIEHPTITRETKYSQYYLQLSVSAKYRIYKTLYVRAGIGADILADQRAKRTETCPTCDYSYDGTDYSSIFNRMMLPITVGLGYELKLNDRLNLMAELFGTMSLTDAYERTDFPDQVQQIASADNFHLQQKPLQLGFSLGIIRSF